MTLLNVEAGLPSQVWAVVRLLTHLGQRVAVDEARALLSPPTLRMEESKSRPPFDAAVGSLLMLGLLREDNDLGGLALTGGAAALADGEDLAAYTAVLRSAVLDEERNSNLGADDSMTGPRDLTRALAWLLIHDPMEPAINWANAQELLDSTDGEDRKIIRQEVLPLFPNPTRWTRLTHWAPALGFAAAPLLRAEGSGPLVPDCTVAVRQTVSALWPAGERVNAVEALRTLRERLPVLPGGAHSLALGFPSPGENVAGSALSFALLRGHEEKWLRLEHDDDARHILHLHDPDRPTSPRSVSDITILEDRRG
ncbi:protein DpdG [Kitasatospora sp. NPDC085879]|uniref:protein DpdG n=1 Tax=Kitasatospora sp. NPDC085879 TaxID=3154769 RepID=UPI0034223297